MVTNWDELPLILTTKDVQKLLTGNGNTPSLSTVRNIMNAEHFPLIKGTKALRCSKDALKQYLIQIGEYKNEK